MPFTWDELNRLLARWRAGPIDRRSFLAAAVGVAACSILGSATRSVAADPGAWALPRRFAGTGRRAQTRPSIATAASFTVENGKPGVGKA
jgi:hypothetical protein